jgi:hypothetical protein
VKAVKYFTSDVPPIITIHGDKDALVPYTQAVRLHKALDGSESALYRPGRESRRIYVRTEPEGMGGCAPFPCGTREGSGRHSRRAVILLLSDKNQQDFVMPYLRRMRREKEESAFPC